MLKPTQQQGVTLIELVTGIVVLAIALTLITSILSPLFVRSTDPWHQVRAAELGHSLMNEILARSFDEQSDRSGGLLRCDEIALGAPACTSESNFGQDGAETRLLFNDVDDFDGFGVTGDAIISNILATELTDLYRSYQAEVTVYYAGGELGLDPRAAKRIIVTIITPTDSRIEFSAYKGNW
ncbi:prepilin-type N-terminal cleavage/methylation domain-containing protein [Alkalimonas collagenimarina]|uniref:Prepilin-type N-terminal cleavage/methylation domain-containing protein n=1 Tax=Alkalimonas collagenimarina TaxID=400390 RepID=A0ABT9H4C2_9GAMM|nr:prepilin-type N-terminal cleavage/methylation domain-containing protein [Alkalimonas collagenimarina]MDP4537760.1 prepilin-type N-terminal cleavage/methylation domain-containing protein [Alkalimonas collagenimarina]